MNKPSHKPSHKPSQQPSHTPSNNRANRPTTQPRPLDADRLFQAAEAAYAAAARHAADNAGRYTPPAALMTAGDPPAELAGFTRDEIADATAFLARMGFLPRG